MSVIDVVFVLLITLLMLRCFIKGLISELLTKAAFILGIIASLIFHKNLGVYLRENFWTEMSNTNPIPEIIAFIILFLIVFIIGKLLEMFLKGIVYGIKLGGIDKLLGLIFGILEGLVLVSLILFIIAKQPFLNTDSFLANSFFAKLLLPLISDVNLSLPEPNVKTILKEI